MASQASGVVGLPGRFSRSFVADPSAPRAARHALRSLSGHVDEELLERGGIVVTELVTNSVKHARLAPEQRIALIGSGRRTFLLLEVIDEGDGFEPVVRRPGAGQGPGGWGLWMVSQLADRWGVDAGHSTRVWCEFERRI